MKHPQFGLNNAKTVLEKKVKVQYVPCKKANISVPCSEHESFHMFSCSEQGTETLAFLHSTYCTFIFFSNTLFLHYLNQIEHVSLFT